MANRKNRLTGPLAPFFIVLLLTGCGRDEHALEFLHQGRTMGTGFHVTVILEEGQTPPQPEVIDRELERINSLMSTYRKDSEINRFNRAPVGASLPVSADFCELLKLSQQVYQLSRGAFNPAVGPLVDLWGFGPADTHDQIPTAKEIARLLGEMDFNALHAGCYQGQIVKTVPLHLDFSAVAKGYAADRVGQLLAERGYRNYLVEVGGELALAGHNASGSAWRIAIEKPALLQGGVQQVISLSDVGVATSGDYRNYFEKDGKRYSHTIDPRTGRPIEHNLASITVVASTAAEADALATALMVLGAEQSLALVEQRNIAAYFLVKQGDKFVAKASGRFAQYLALEGSL